MENVKNLSVFCLSRAKKIQFQIMLLRKKKRQQLLNIKLQKTMQIYYYSQLLNSRIVWTHSRYGCFWENDVPIMSNEMFIENFRMSRQTFQLLCLKLTLMSKINTKFRKCIPLQKRVAIALYSLKTSSEYASIAHMFGVSKARVCLILHEFCKNVWESLSEEYLPSNFINETKIKECVNGFKKIGFPQCFGAIDGCHFEVHPSSSETCDYYNYKGWYSVVLLAVVDYRYRFLYINVGCPGRCNDSTIFERSVFRSKMHNPIFQQQSIFYDGVKILVMLIGDSAFRLSECMMKPYPFNVNASEKQRIFKARFRRLGKGIDNKIVNVNNIIKCCCVLHNFLNQNNEIFNDTWHQSNCTTTSGQLNSVDFTYDFNSKGEQIRNAIANLLTNKQFY